jgi:hypothetical protein
MVYLGNEGLLTSDKLPDIPRQAIEHSTTDDTGGPDVHCDFASKSTAEVITNETEDDCREEE